MDKAHAQQDFSTAADTAKAPPAVATRAIVVDTPREPLALALYNADSAAASVSLELAEAIALAGDLLAAVRHRLGCPAGTPLPNLMHEQFAEMLPIADAIRLQSGSKFPAISASGRDATWRRRSPICMWSKQMPRTPCFATTFLRTPLV